MLEKASNKRFTKNQNTPMTESQYTALCAFAEEKNVKLADVMRAALAMFLETHGDKDEN